MTNESTLVVKLPEDFYPIDLHWAPKSVGGKKPNQSEIFALTSSDGKCLIVLKSCQWDTGLFFHCLIKFNVSLVLQFVYSTDNHITKICD